MARLTNDDRGNPQREPEDKVMFYVARELPGGKREYYIGEDLIVYLDEPAARKLARDMNVLEGSSDQWRVYSRRLPGVCRHPEQSPFIRVLHEYASA